MKKLKKREMPEVKAINWFKTAPTHKRHGHIHIERYFQVLNNGTISVIDMTRKRFNNQRSFGGLPVTLESSSHEEWKEKGEELRKLIQIML